MTSRSAVGGTRAWSPKRDLGYPLVHADDVGVRRIPARLHLVDATYNPFDPPVRAAKAFDRAHPPGASYLALDSLRDEAIDLPNMLPTPESFARRVSALGIGQDDTILLYDASPYRTAARAWWMFRMFGVEDVWIMDGGLRAWCDACLPLTSLRTSVQSAHFVPHGPRAGVRSAEEVMNALERRMEQIVDARSPERFHGLDPDPHGLPGGHIAGSTNLPFTALLDETGRFLAVDLLRSTFERAGIDPGRPITATCGSGVSAAVIYVAAELCGSPEPGLYDGSWSEWSRIHGTDPPHASAQAARNDA